MKTIPEHSIVSKERHPQLWACMQEIRGDNGLDFIEWGGIEGKEETRVPSTYTPQELDTMEETLKPLSQDEIETLNSGEHTEAVAIRDKYGIGMANGFLEKYFECFCTQKETKQ